jgi:hypothetical protein
MTEIASAVESVADGLFSLIVPSSVCPDRSSRNTVTTRRISSSAGVSPGSSSARPSSSTRRCTICTSSSASSGSGRTTVLKRRRSALESSFTPRSRSFAVAITLKPLLAWTSTPSSGTGSVFSESTVMRASCTSEGMRVSSSTRTSRASRMAVMTGLATSAASVGPSAIRRA